MSACLLDDIYGSAPASPNLSGAEALKLDCPREPRHEILSDLPARRRALDTDAYREGLADSKGLYVQQGFDEGYSLGASLGIRVGYILGILHGFVAAWKGNHDGLYQESRAVYEAAQKELAMQELLGRQWVTEEGIWAWHVAGMEEEDGSFGQVAEQHPIVKKWTGTMQDMAGKWSVHLQAVEKWHAAKDGQ
ncbi:Essential protein Yae1, N terminal [Pleosporales sp. CAS-2024a]